MNYKEKYLKHLEDEGITYLSCERCGASNAPAYDVHHIIYKAETQSKERDNIRNLILLCRKCHEFMHGDKKHREELVKERKLKELYENIC